MGLSVPDNIAITGSDNLEISSILDKRLTTVRIDSHTMGAMAAKRLLEQGLSSQKKDPVIDIGYEILWRDTTP
jgi:DNA-binding LacI/PurR family transcriptional regulator